ncbi:MAG: 3-dehydroquinate synthase [Rhizobiaceae bacterium]
MISDTVTVDLGSRSYPIHIGGNLVAQAGKLIAGLRPGARCAIVTDANVNACHGDTLRVALDSSGLAHTTITIPPGESSKSFSMLERVVSGILDARLERGDLVLAFGGGVVGDLAGFAASIARRGMDFVQIPTSLLAQVDSSVGGKTGINASQGKNLVGAFHQPVMVIADTTVLRTLPAREFAAGYAEVVKYGLINRPEFFEWLEDHRADIFGFGPSLAQAIAQSCQAKADVVASDETENGMRALLNLGHTFGHALEGATGYDSRRLVHGEGVAIGMVLAHEYSNRTNLCDADTVARVRRHLTDAGLPVSTDQIPGEKLNADQLMGYIFQDKKVSRGKLTFILTRGLGKSYIAKDVVPSEVHAFLSEKTKS